MRRVGEDYVPGEAIVRFKAGTTPSERASARGRAGVGFERSLRGLERAQIVAVQDRVPVAVRALERQPDVAYAQPNYRYRAVAVPPHWQTYVENGGIEWGLTPTAASGSYAITDSPGTSYASAATSEIYRSDPLDLAGERGCRMHFRAMYQVEPLPDEGFYDLFVAGAVSGAEDDPLWGYAGQSGGYPSAFGRAEISISSLDGRNDVTPVFALWSDETIQQDGAYVDDLRVFCRDDSYIDGISPAGQYDQPDVGNYVRFQGTSMAAPHVSGVAALVRAAVPSATYADVIDAIKDGGAPLDSLSDTVTGCTADAVGAIAVALGTRSGPCASSTAPAAPERPDDTFLDELWGLDDVQLPTPGVGALAAWETTKGAGQVIAIVDTGVDLTHPDLEANLWTGPGGVRGFDAVDGDGDPDDYEFHGTHVAGTAAALAGNGTGIAGVAPEAQIMPVRVLDGDGSGTSADIAEGIVFAAQNGADVINLSLGGPGATDSAMSTAISTASTFDAVVVAAAGNDATDNDSEPTVPCTLPNANIICVAAVDESGARAGFSNFGSTSVDVGAPGTSILSAKTDYGAPLLADGFESPPPPPSDNTTDDPPPPPPSPTLPPSDTTATPPPLTTPSVLLPARKRKLRVSRRGVLRYVFKAADSTAGRIAFRTARKVRVGRGRRHLVIAGKRFKVAGSGKVVVKVKLRPKKLRILRHNRRLPLRVIAKVRDDAGQTATARKRLTLLAPRPRRRG